MVAPNGDPSSALDLVKIPVESGGGLPEVWLHGRSSGRNEEGSAAEVPGLIAAEVRGPRKGEPMGRCHAPKNIVMVVMAILGVLVATLSSPAQPAADK